MKILFICTGNTCRSSMAEALMKKYVSLSDLKNDDIEVLSAGLSIIPGDRASENSVRALSSEEDIDITNHMARQLTLEMVNDADLILTMTNGHRNAIVDAVKSASDKTYTLNEYAYGVKKDVVDPYGRDYDAYKECYAEIKQCIIKIIQNLEEKTK